MPKFEHPEHLWLLAAIPLLALLVLGYWLWRQQALRQLGEPKLLLRLLPGFSATRFWLKNALLAVALLFLALAWANPRRGAKSKNVTQQSADVFIALDISQSMWAKDVVPSRLALAQRFARKLVQALEGERIGLIFFAGNAFLQMPLSTDYDFSLQSLQTASPDLITEQGTAIPAAIDLALESFATGTGGGRMLILITDGESHDEEAVERAAAAADDGVVICTVGVGTLTGGPISIDGVTDGAYKRDEQGQVITTRLNEALLAKIARAGGGATYNIGQGDRVITALRREVDRLQKRTVEVRSFTEFESYYQWLLLPAILLLAVEQWLLFQDKKRTIK